ncbi:ATP-grasp fold amidoligase family protein [Aeromonas caviae]|uniref:ATP-grasp fold amidoligase family protein n=1 Tax=Aeromonas caviae TaxID=648 RepID=UPI00375534B1
MNKNIKNFVRDTLRFLFGKDLYNKVRFVITHKYYPDLITPRSFSEKIFARKYNSKSKGFSSYVDKYTVRKYVSETIGEQYLVPLIKKTEYVTPEFFSDTPEQFVIKTSNGGGGENVVIVKNKSTLGDLVKLSKKFNTYLNEKIGSKIDEQFYDIEKPTLLMEALLVHKNGALPSDYKLHIFNDDVNTIVFIQVDTDRFTNHKRSIFTEDLMKANFGIQPKYQPVTDDYSFPSNMDELVYLGKKLAAPFKYVRVDMYNLDGNIYFGEMTFCHGSGWEPFSCKEADFLLGGYWHEYDSNHC